MNMALRALFDAKTVNFLKDKSNASTLHLLNVMVSQILFCLVLTIFVQVPREFS